MEDTKQQQQSQQHRPRSAFVTAAQQSSATSSPRSSSSSSSKRHVSTPRRALIPPESDDDDEAQEAAAEREAAEKAAGKENVGAGVSERLSPEKEMALQTLDDVIQEAEESIGMRKSALFLSEFIINSSLSPCSFIVREHIGGGLEPTRLVRRRRPSASTGPKHPHQRGGPIRGRPRHRSGERGNSLLH